ncbi:putative membrane protein [Alloalcanivorax dieselolei B5]|uniref:Putative membrane protein n=1 Tax=Alcanivorax dieselolei (strain DSM 16502 / CGMCC 1.3690 / MCCC 1A00001 / B-5) TaxID=930169 RepID=K0CHS0_ALCDB|nr:DUF2061 domain-containing protein [Alloalcanivorax dieselolei]AFT71950.1 putative membrane protein [Alloalcanivorax dieselolei B5]GGK08519.1 hypothetical protein GCM10007426_41010 [Alloalcanivorax dieselolei]
MVKTFSFGIMHISVAFLVVWAMTGDWRIGGATAMVEPCVNTVAYHFHEKIWKRWQRRRVPREEEKAALAA